MPTPRLRAMAALTVLIALCFGAPIVAQAGALDLQAPLDARVAKNNGYGGGIIRVQQGDTRILWQGVSGNWGRQSSPIAPLSTFEIASISKTFTAVLILQMHEDPGSPVKLWTRIGQLLPPDLVRGLLVVGGRDYGPDIRVRELLQHTSGLPDYWSSRDFIREFTRTNRFWYPHEMVGYAKAMRPKGIPGAVWHYADTNYVLLGMIIERVTGQPLEEVYRQRIFQPLGMTETYLAYREPAVSSRRESHRFQGRTDLYGKLRWSADWASGGLVSNVVDLQKLMRGLFRGQLFKRPGTLTQMKQWIPANPNEYGRGLFRRDLGADGELWGHGGWGSSFMYYWPQQDIGFTGTLNQVNNDWEPLVYEAIAQWLAP